MHETHRANQPFKLLTYCYYEMECVTEKRYNYIDEVQENQPESRNRKDT